MSSSITDTPRTDAEIMFPGGGIAMVRPEFARQLERELTIAKAQLTDFVCNPDARENRAMTTQEVFDNWSAYLRDVDRADFKAHLELLVSSETAPIADDSLDGRRYRYLRGRNCGRAALDLGDEEDCWLDLNPRDLDVAIDESLKLNAAPQATDAPSALGEEASNASRLAAAVLDSASLKAALRWLSRTYASQAHIGTEYEQTIESVLREQDRR